LKGGQNTEEMEREENHQDTASNPSVGPDNETQNMQIPEGFGGFQNSQIIAQQVEESNSFFSSSHSSTTVEVTPVHEGKIVPDFTNLVQVSEENLSEKCADASVENIITGLEENKGDADTISISSQKNNTLNTLKSYANILSGGIKKVGNVFKPKPKEETFKEKVPDPVYLLPTNPETAVEETPKPEIPGLLFKEMERRPSKKKRKSRPSSCFIESELNLVEDMSSVDESAKRLESKIFEIMTTTGREKETTPGNENKDIPVKNIDSQNERK